MSAHQVNDILQYVSAAAFALLGVVSLALWLRRRSRPSLWAALCFGSLGAVALVGQLLPEDPVSNAEIVAQRALVIALILFPYFLVRFTTAFVASRRLDRLAVVATAALTVWTILLPDFPAAGEHRSVGFSLYIYALVLQFGILSTIAAYRLWAAGRDQPSVARNRMRLLCLAALALTAALFFAALIPVGRIRPSDCRQRPRDRERPDLPARPRPAGSRPGRLEEAGAGAHPPRHRRPDGDDGPRGGGRIGAAGDA